MTAYTSHRYKHRYFSSRGKPITLKKQIMQSGEATLWQVTDPDKVAKIYHEPSLEKALKLRTMIERPPKDPTQNQGHLSIVWPQELIFDEQKAVVGFLMTKIRKANTLGYVYNPKLRRQFAKGFNWYYLHTACMNLAWILKALHEKNYVIGDIKTENFLVTPHALVSILDTDSFQIEKHHCPVGSEGFTPPELIDEDLLTVKREPYHDMFGIAVIFYLMLFGHHPFSGTWKGQGPMPSRDSLVKQGFWVLGPNSPVKLAPYSLSLSILHPKLQDLFHQTFTKGHVEPTCRPQPELWIKAFQESLGSLEMCNKQAGHFYYHKVTESCPWCSMQETLGLDPFPTPKDFSKDRFLVQKRFEKAQREGDDKSLLMLWKNPSSKIYLQEDKSKLAYIQQAGMHQDFLEQFQQTFIKGPQKDEVLLSLWEKCKSFANSAFSREKRSSLGGKTPNSIMQQVFQRQDIIKNILSAYSKEPQDFIKVYNLWKEVGQKSHPVFKVHMPIIEEATQKARTYQLLEKAIQKEEVEKIAQLWDEKSFSKQACKDGLKEKIQKALESCLQKNHDFQPMSTSVFHTPTLINLKWHWGESSVNNQGAYISMDFSHYPKSPEEVRDSALTQLITKTQYLENRGAWIKLAPEYAGQKAYISIWPAQLHCGKFALSGDPLHLTFDKKEKVVCRLSYPKSKWKERFLKLFKRHYLRIELCPSKEIEFPEMDVVAAFGYPPISYGQGTFFIGSLPKMTIKQQEKRTFLYALPKWFNHEFEISILSKSKDNLLKENIYYEMV